MNKRKRSQSLNSGVLSMAPIIVGVVSGIFLCTALLLGLAFIFLKSSRPPGSLVEPIMLMSAGVGAFGGGYFAARMSKEKGLIYGFLSSFVMFVFIFIAGLISVRKPLSLLTLMRLFIMLFSGGLGGIIGTNKKR